MKRKQVTIKKEPTAIPDWTSLFSMPELENEAETTPAASQDPMEVAQSSSAHVRADADARARAQTLSAASRLFVDVFAAPQPGPAHKKHKKIGARDPEELETEDYLVRKQITMRASSDIVETGQGQAKDSPRPEPLSYEAKRLFAAMRNPEGVYYKPGASAQKAGKKPGTAGQSASAKSKAAAALLASEAGHDSDTQDAKLTHRILRYSRVSYVSTGRRTCALLTQGTSETVKRKRSASSPS